MNREWLNTGTEPTVSELLSDPIVHLVMRRDGIGPSHVQAAIEQALDRLSGRSKTSVRLGRPGARAA